MSVYHGDNATSFKKSIDSLLSQTRKPDEIVLVVDGPVGDEINKVISDFEKSCENFSDGSGAKILFIAVCAAESNGRTELDIKYNDNSLPGQIQLCYFDIFRSCYLNVFI